MKKQWNISQNKEGNPYKTQKLIQFIGSSYQKKKLKPLLAKQIPIQTEVDIDEWEE